MYFAILTAEKSSQGLYFYFFWFGSGETTYNVLPLSAMFQLHHMHSACIISYPVLWLKILGGKLQPACLSSVEIAKFSAHDFFLKVKNRGAYSRLVKVDKTDLLYTVDRRMTQYHPVPGDVCASSPPVALQHHRVSLASGDDGGARVLEDGRRL